MGSRRVPSQTLKATVVVADGQSVAPGDGIRRYARPAVPLARGLPDEIDLPDETDRSLASQPTLLRGFEER
eukprot:5325348-Prymnesium_polylepis.1